MECGGEAEAAVVDIWPCKRPNTEPTTVEVVNDGEFGDGGGGGFGFVDA